MTKEPRSPLLSNRNFILLWCAYGISALGDHLSEMAVLKTQNALSPDVDVTPLQARMTFMFMAPFFLLGPITGALADRLPRRGLMIAADLVRALIMFNFAFLIGRFAPLGSWGVFVPLLIVGVFAALFSPARSSLLPTLVAPSELVQANALINGLGMIATMLSSAVGGALAAKYHPDWAFRIDAATFIASAACVFAIAAPRHAARRLAPAGGDGVLDPLVSGFRYVRQHRHVGELLVIAVVFWFCAATIRSVIPAIVKTVYQGGYQAMANFPVWLGLGLVIGALLITLLSNALRSEVAITWSLFGVALGVLGLAFTVFVPLPTWLAHALGAIAVFVMGVFGAGIAASYNALLQRIVPDHFRGRIFGVFDTVTIAGLLLATGLLGIPQWPDIDHWVGYLLIAVALLAGVTGYWTLHLRLSAASVPRWVAFWWQFNELLMKFWHRVERVGPCTVPRSGPVIIAANHVSTPDPLFIYATCRHRVISFMTAEEYTHYPFARQLMQLIECIPVRRGEHDVRATKAALRLLKAGKALGLFIEGGIPKPGQPREVKEGVALLALRTGAQVIPAHISGARYFEGIFESLLSRHHARVRYGAPVDLSEFGAAPARERLSAATRKIVAAIEALAPSHGSHADASV